MNWLAFDHSMHALLGYVFQQNFTWHGFGSFDRLPEAKRKHELRGHDFVFIKEALGILLHKFAESYGEETVSAGPGAIEDIEIQCKSATPNIFSLCCKPGAGGKIF